MVKINLSLTLFKWEKCQFVLPLFYFGDFWSRVDQRDFVSLQQMFSIAHFVCLCSFSVPVYATCGFPDGFPTLTCVLPLQVGGRGHRSQPKHARGLAYWPRAVRSAGPQEMAVRCVVQRCDSGQHDGGWRTTRVSS